MTLALVRVHSHRARVRLTALLGREPRGYYSLQRAGDFRDVPADRMLAILALPGISPALRRDDLRKYHR